MIIEIEGIDGVGKTTVAKLLAEKIGATYLKFPDRTTPTGEVIDQMLRDKRTHDPVTFQALCVMNRLEKVKTLWPGYKWHRDKHVVCDRYEQSAYVYGMQDGLDRAWLEAIMERVPEAGLHVLLHMDPARLDAERLAGRDREVYEARGVMGLVAQQGAFIDIWDKHLNDPEWVKFNTEYFPADVIVTTLASALKVMVL